MQPLHQASDEGIHQRWKIPRPFASLPRVRTRLSLVMVVLAASGGCKNPDVLAAEARQKEIERRTAEGKAALESGDYERAIGNFKIITSYVPTDPKPYMFLAEGHRMAGNDAAAILALRQAADLAKSSSPFLKRQLGELYRRTGNFEQAVKVYAELRDAGELTDEEILLLARLQAQNNDVAGAFETLEKIQRKHPDDPKAKVLEAEILLLSGDEMKAAKLMDRLVSENNLPGARVLRARYFLNANYPENALQDLAGITGPAAQTLEVVELQARALNELHRYDEAEKILQLLMATDPKNPDLLAELAETKLNRGEAEEAEALVDQALQIRHAFARALYVRARAREVQNDERAAAENFQLALRSDPTFGPALSRIWRIYKHNGQKSEAMDALERLFSQNEASTEEKVELSAMYGDTHINLERAKRLVEEALRRDPDNARYKEILELINRVIGLQACKGCIQVIKVHPSHR